MTTPENKRTLALLVPMHNEQASIPLFFPAIREVMETVEDIEYKVICVDDGSSDDTLKMLLAEAENDSHVQVIVLSRNFGKESAMTCALDYCNADAAIPIDADLQDPPELIVDMVRQWRAGFDVVYAKRVDRNADMPLKRGTAGTFYKVFNKLSQVQIPENVGDYRLMDRKLLNALKKLPEKDRFMKGLFCWPGFSSTTLEFVRQERAAGDTKFNYWKLWNFALSGITSFSSMPIRLGVYVGLSVSLAAFCYGVFIVVRTLLTGVDEPGYASLMVVVLFLGGIQLFFMGLMGEYIGRIYTEVKNRPIYLVAETSGFEEDYKA